MYPDAQPMQSDTIQLSDQQKQCVICGSVFGNEFPLCPICTSSGIPGNVGKDGNTSHIQEGGIQENSTPGRLNAFRYTKKGSSEQKTPTKVSRAKSVMASPTDGKFHCERCPKKFQTRQGLSRHMEHHTGKYKYWCEQCRKGFLGHTNYKNHMDKHSGRCYFCQFCSKMFATQKSYNEHRRKMHGIHDAQVW